MKTAILFDLDGTLLNSIEDLCDAVNHTLGQYGRRERTLDEVLSFVGNGAKVLIQLAFENDPIAEEALLAFRAYYNDHCRIKTAPYPGIPQALAVLQERYPIGIVSNKPDSAAKSLCADFFPGIYALGETQGCPRKPAADMVFKAMEEIGADSCIYVGDSDVDILTAKNAGVPCLSVVWGFRSAQFLKESGGTHFCSDPTQLAEAVENLMTEVCHGK